MIWSAVAPQKTRPRHLIITLKNRAKKSKLASLWALIVSGFFAFIIMIQILENYLFK